MTEQTLITSDAWTKTTCAYCGVGCGIEAKVTEGATGPSVEVRGDPEHPANFGRLCSKGLALGETLIPDGRLLSPSVNGQTTDWDSALDHVAQGFRQVIDEHGPNAVAFYVSGQLLTEDYYVANKLMKGFIGSGNIDTNSRLCMSSSVAGHKRAFGSDTVPGSYSDFESADLVVLTGSNLAWCHPVLFQRLKAAKAERPHMKVVVIDPRRTDTCAIADLHLPINPGTDVLLFNGLLSALAKGNALDRDFIDQHTEGFDKSLAAAQSDAPDLVSLVKTLGISPEALATFYQWFVATERTVTVYSQGVNQSSAGSDKVNAILNCHLATGRIGKPGAGPFSVTGQPNAMGGREVGGLANTLAGHMEFGNPQHHKTLSDFWQAPALAREPGLKAVDLFDAVDSGEIKAIWIMATNPVMSLPDADRIQRALNACPLVVVSDCIADTDTTRCADVLLPATGWAEKSGTVTNSERRISRQRALVPAAGDAKPDWWMIAEVGRRMGFAEAFDYADEAAVFREYAALTGADNGGSRDLDISAYAHLERDEYDALPPRQWPLPADRAPDMQEKRFFADGLFYTPSGRGRLVPVHFRPAASKTSSDYPLILNTGRIRDQWHSMTRTGLSARLSGHQPEPFINLHPDDAQRLGLVDSELADVRSRHGEARVRITTSDQCRPGQVFMPMHWNQVQASQARVCALVAPNTDPVSGQPENKYTPVAISPWRSESEAILITRDKLPSLATDYWSARKIDAGYLYVIASSTSAAELAAQLDALCATEDDSQRLAFGNNAQGDYRSAVLRDSTIVSAYAVASTFGEKDMTWLGQLFGLPFGSDITRSLFKGEPSAALAAGKTVCACKQVGEKTLCNAIRAQGLKTVEAVCAATTAGTGCGSCLPELAQLLAREAEGSGEAVKKSGAAA
ncbi:nitrate reductase [Marinimicrobium alkaliphilum]|uniref:nitrate reductase n=1 Tax=Marinimicrobium alkaliphilum TaxID=2202654 RepID=UPI0018E09827|nr:nitrate reductase [Marinimicrobium alkaliphilum]